MPIIQDSISLYTFLNAAINDRGTTALHSVKELAESARDQLIKYPALAAMVCWGEGGLVTIKNIALADDSTTKNINAALKIFATLASGNQFDPILLYIHDDNFLNQINDSSQTPGLQDVAKHQLAELVLALPNDDLLIPLGTTFAQMSLSGADMASELISALSTKWLRFGPPTLQSYDEMLKNNANDEPAFQEFFIKNPQLLEPMAAQVWSQPDFHGALEPDFVIRRWDNTYLIVEIECPGKTIVTQGNQLSAAATHAEKQASDYKSFLTERLTEVQAHYPHLRDPDCLVVIGLEQELSTPQKKALTLTNESRHKLKIVGFDWLAERSKTIMENMSSGDIEVLQRSRLT